MRNLLQIQEKLLSVGTSQATTCFRWQFRFLVLIIFSYADFCAYNKLIARFHSWRYCANNKLFLHQFVLEELLTNTLQEFSIKHFSDYCAYNVIACFHMLPLCAYNKVFLHQKFSLELHEFVVDDCLNKWLSSSIQWINKCFSNIPVCADPNPNPKKLQFINGSGLRIWYFVSCVDGELLMDATACVF
jgi:hypothetical protein